MVATWQVDDIKVSRKYPLWVTKFAAYLSSIYCKNLKVACVKVHDYLGMDLDYSKYGKVKISMIKYVKNILDALPEEIGHSATWPATYHIFQIRD